MAILKGVYDPQNRIEPSTCGADPRSNQPKTIEAPLVSVDEICE